MSNKFFDAIRYMGIPCLIFGSLLFFSQPIVLLGTYLKSHDIPFNIMNTGYMMLTLGGVIVYLRYKYEDTQQELIEQNNTKIKNNEHDIELQQAHSHIAELEQELATCREQLEAAQREISSKEGLEPAHAEEFPAEYEGHGIFTMVAKLVDDRTPIEDIMRSVSSETGFLTNREAGYFFHPSPEGKATSTLQNYIKNRVKSEAIS